MTLPRPSNRSFHFLLIAGAVIVSSAGCRSCGLFSCHRPQPTVVPMAYCAPQVSPVSVDGGGYQHPPAAAGDYEPMGGDGLSETVPDATVDGLPPIQPEIVLPAEVPGLDDDSAWPGEPEVYIEPAPQPVEAPAETPIEL